MSENNGGSNFAFFVAGLGIGALLALLFAPKSGEETRNMIAQKATEGRDYVATRGKELRRQAEEQGSREPAEGPASSRAGGRQAGIPGRERQTSIALDSID